MSQLFQPVSDPAVEQNFRALERLFPVRELADDVVGPGQLADSAKELFLQLVAAGARKVNVGTGEATYGGASLEATANVTHGLGATVLYADITPEDAGYVTGTDTYGATTFKAKVQKRDGTTPGAGTKAKFHWIAIG